MKAKRMILMHIPNKKCNLKCRYCYLSQINEWVSPPEQFKYDIKHIAYCLRKERLGGACLINLTGDGETMLQPQIVDLCRLLLEEGHYIEFVTNCTVSKIVDEFVSLPKKLLCHIEFKISFHYAELKEKRMTDRFWSNVNKIKNAGCSFTLELMPNDEIIKDIDEIIQICKEKVGERCHLTVGRADFFSTRELLTILSKEEYATTWSRFESKMFDLKMKLLSVKRKEFCYAGDWTLYVNLYSGDVAPCYAQAIDQNIFENPNKPIKFRAVGKHCREPYCINGHAHISLGVIPEYDAPTYAEIRNRICDDGSEWLTKECKEFFETKLYDTNELYNRIEKVFNYFGWYFRFGINLLKDSNRIKQKLKKLVSVKANH